jgi:primosomal protein N'
LPPYQQGKTEMSKVNVPDGAPKVGSFVSVPFGSAARQIGLVVGYGMSKHGGTQIKVRAWNATQRKWMPNPRAVPFGDWIKAASADHLPSPV